MLSNSSPKLDAGSLSPGKRHTGYFHSGSHRHLFDSHVSSPRVEALVVPTSRPSSHLRAAITLAAHLRCPLIVLCSGSSSTFLAEKMAKSARVELIAIDIDALPTGLMPQLQSTLLLSGTKFEYRADTWLKRNLGLLLSRFLGWKRIVFLDDDVSVPEPHHLYDAVRLLDSYDSVGLFVGGFIDNSVVCHAYREVGGHQENFLSGGALAIDTEKTSSFFPGIYNEDWFFLLNDQHLRPTAMVGIAIQRPVEIYRHAARARNEEFGDCLAEGVFRLLDDGRPIQDADVPYWRYFLADRLKLIEGIVQKVALLDKDPEERALMSNALNAAYDRCELIEPALCVEFLNAWRADRIQWRKHLVDLDAAKDHHRDRAPESVLAKFDLMKQTRYVPARGTKKLWYETEPYGTQPSLKLGAIRLDADYIGPKS